MIQEGDYTELLPDHPTVLAYKRQLESSSLVVYSNFSEEPADIQVADEFLSGYRKLIGNDETNQLQSELTLSPFETIAFIKQ